MLLTNIPEELLDIIVHRVDRGSLKVLRLTSKLFERLASALIWDRIWISSHPLDLAVFKRVTASRFARNIRELVWDDTTLQRPLMNWENFVNVCELGHPLRRGAKYSPTREAFEIWHDIASKHHFNRTLHEDLNALTAALPRLENLTRIVLTNRNVEPIPHEDDVPEYGSSPTVRFWRHLPERLPLPPSVCWYTDSYAAWDSLGDMVDIDYLDDALPDISFHGAIENARPFRGLVILLHALDAQRAIGRGPTIKEFVIRPSYEPSTTSEPGISLLFFQRSSVKMTQMTSLFENLRVLNLVISNGLHKALGLSVTRNGNIAHCLRAARSLEDLTLELDTMPILFEGPSNTRITGAMDPNFAYGKLRKVTFIYGEFHSEVLVQWLQNQPVLQDVHLYKCSMDWPRTAETRKSWKDLLYELKHEKLPYESFVIEDCTSSTDFFYNNAHRPKEQIKDFVLKDGPCPIDVSKEEWITERFRTYDKYY
ncbi:MAG: hypothetical protein M1820_001025 [Bogoriella megaspora]|nr:MAG: hypothetical protein M1820_001025 [Bogoriella megaspora]